MENLFKHIGRRYVENPVMAWNSVMGVLKSIKNSNFAPHIADKKISNLLITNSKNNITKNQDIVALRYIIIYHFTKFEVSI